MTMKRTLFFIGVLGLGGAADAGSFQNHSRNRNNKLVNCAFQPIRPWAVSSSSSSLAPLPLRLSPLPKQHRRGSPNVSRLLSINAVNGDSNAINGDSTNGINGASINGVNGDSTNGINGVNGDPINGVNGGSNAINGASVNGVNGDTNVVNEKQRTNDMVNKFKSNIIQRFRSVDTRTNTIGYKDRVDDVNTIQCTEDAIETIEHDEDFDGVMCRVVGQSDGQLPPVQSITSSGKNPWAEEIYKLDVIYHAMAHEETRELRYTDRTKKEEAYNEMEEQKLMATLRASLDDAGFQLLDRRDLDLCEGLNAGYLLRLSIVPDLADLDKSIARAFYPEITELGAKVEDLLPFGGRVLVFRRGYTSEVSRGQLLVQKLDYLQASLVQKAASSLRRRLVVAEQRIVRTFNNFRRSVRSEAEKRLKAMGFFRKPSDPPGRKGTGRRSGRTNGDASSQVGTDKDFYYDDDDYNNNWVYFDDDVDDEDASFFKLGRYGGSKIKFVGSPDIEDALSPFTICAVDGEEDLSSVGLNDMEAKYKLNNALNKGLYDCQYDSSRKEGPGKASLTNPLPATLLERVSISNVVDYFTKDGGTFFKRLFSEAELVEPTYEEVVVVWRPKKKPTKQQRVILPPKAVYDVAEVFDLEDKLPKRPEPVADADPQRLEIRAFDKVPMANVLGVMPKTRLVLRPADAFVFDSLTIGSLLLVLGSLRFDNPRLDLIAIVTVGLWLFRTFVRYSNKLARYDLLVKNFLTSKIAHRNAGALEYIATEAGTQRGRRAALLHSWLLQHYGSGRMTVDRDEIRRKASAGVNDILAFDRFLFVDIDAGLNDLEDLELIRFGSDEETLVEVTSATLALDTLKSSWMKVFDRKLSLMELIGRRRNIRGSMSSRQ